MSEQHRKMGYEAGREAGSWVFDGNTDEATYQVVLEGYEEGDPEIMDLEPGARKSMVEILGDDTDDDEAANDFEAGFSEGFWSEIIETCRHQLAS
jgi:hypothetical protein